jgi:hypothetical protein
MSAVCMDIDFCLPAFALNCLSRIDGHDVEYQEA